MMIPKFHSFAGEQPALSDHPAIITAFLLSKKKLILPFGILDFCKQKFTAPPKDDDLIQLEQENLLFTVLYSLHKDEPPPPIPLAGRDKFQAGQ